MLTLCLASLMIGCATPAHRQAPIDTTFRWFLLSTYIPRDADLAKAIKDIDDAGAAGYNGVVYQDLSLASRPTITPDFVSRIGKLTAEAKKMNMEIIPMTAPLGQDLVDRDPSLAEAMPNRNVQFTLVNGQFKPSDPLPIIANGGFEAYANNLPTGFKSAPPPPEMAIFQDTAVHHGGASSLRVEGKAGSQNGKGGYWMSQSLAVLPWHRYRLSVWTKTLAAQGSGVYLNVYGSNGQAIGYPKWTNSADWVRNDTVFNSEADTQVSITLGIQPIPNAKIWLDDVTIDNVGLLNIVRRDDCPVIIRGNDGTIYNEGVDVGSIADPYHVKGMGAGHMDVEHDAPLAVNLSNSRIHEGQSVLMDYYTAELINDCSGICVNEPKAKAILKDQIERSMNLIHPHYIFLSVSEDRLFGWDPACEATGLNAGGIIAKLIQEETAWARAIDPTVQIVLYNDQFDPYANSKDQYYLARGGTTGSIKGVPKDAIFVNWNLRNPKQSLNYFSQLGYRQIIWGYYDNDNGAIPIAEWEKMAQGIPGIKGFGYATWIEDYSQLAKYYHQAMTGTSN